jgi:hypothetical protein
MKVGAVVLLAILLGVFLAVGQCGSGSADEKDDDSHSSSSASDDDGDSDDDKKSDDDDDKKSDDDDDKKSDDDDDKKSDDDNNNNKNSGDDDSGSSLAEAMKQQLESDGLQVRQMSTAENDDCAANSYGEVRDYFSGHPCQGVQRAWYEVSDDEDNAAVLSVAWVEMPDAEAANDLKRLVDRPGTGNVTELSKADGPYQDVRYSGWYYRSDVDGATFRSVQAEPLAGNDGSREVARKASGVTATD